MIETVNRRFVRYGVILVLGVVFVCTVLNPISITAKEFRNNQYGYFIDIPESWIVASGSDPAQISFSDPSSQAVLQLISFSSDRFGSTEEMAQYVRSQFGAQGDTAPFTYQDRPAVLADLTFSTGSFQARGYFFFLHDSAKTYGASFLVMCTVPVSQYNRFHDQILSSVNSFAPDEQSRNSPGPVSQFYYPFPPPNAELRTADIPMSEADGGEGTAGAEISYRIDPEEAEVSQIFIEREARILSAYSPSSQARWGGNGEGWKSAWKRYYRTIFRDNYLRLASLAEGLEEAFSLQEVPRDEIPRIVLKWLQGFRYVRVPSLSDLSSPVTAVIERTGDCDSLALVYSILLDHMGFDTILLISNRYAHALGGVVTDGAGARLEFEEKSYLLAEMTEEVDMGLIPQDMADPAGWIPVRLRQSPVM